MKQVLRRVQRGHLRGDQAHRLRNCEGQCQVQGHIQGQGHSEVRPVLLLSLAEEDVCAKRKTQWRINNPGLLE